MYSHNLLRTTSSVSILGDCSLDNLNMLKGPEPERR